MVKIKIAKMSCEHCAHRIEQGLQSITGVKKATVDFTTKIATVTCKKDIDVNLLTTKISDLVYEVVSVEED